MKMHKEQFFKVNSIGDADSNGIYYIIGGSKTIMSILGVSTYSELQFYHEERSVLLLNHILHCPMN
jgi:hypothetical protein